tara:strand:- start:1567 stop:2121 length:555 start_codon:yes stop_codon:yes gene_type:complete
MNNGTDINQLMKDVTNNKLTNEENNMVDSIISDLNTGEKEVSQQQKMPQLTEEERNMLIKQEQHERQMIMERQEMAHRQQQIQQQQLHQRRQMENLQEQQNKLNEIKEESFIDKMKGLLYDNKEVFILLLISLIFNTDSVDNLLRFKDVPFFYDIQFEESKFSYVVVKSLIISIIFGVVHYVTK